MPNHRAASRWEHPTYRYAYVREYRGMACTVIHGSPPRSTGFAWAPGAREDAMQILNRRLREYLHGGTLDEGSMTCVELFEQFCAIRFPKVGKWMQYEYARYMAALVPGSLQVRQTTRIRQEILKALAASDYSQNTKRNALKRVRSIFKFGIEQGWLRTNPVHSDMLPDEVVHEPAPYSDEDLALALDQLEGRNHAFVAFLMATGCRAGEARNLTWEMVHDDHVVIDGKRVKSGRERLRVIPYFLCPEIPEILQEARTAEWSSPDRVFGVKNYQPIARALSNALGGHGRGFHDIRKWKINKWVRDGWPEKVIEAVAGHDLAVSKKHYRTRLTVDDLVRLMLDSDSKKTP